MIGCNLETILICLGSALFSAISHFTFITVPHARHYVIRISGSNERVGLVPPPASDLVVIIVILLESTWVIHITSLLGRRL